MLIRSYFIDVDVVDVDVKLFYLSPPKVFVLFVERGFVTLHILFLLALERKERRNPRTLDCRGKLSLVLCAVTAHSSGKHFAGFGYKLL